MALNFTTNITPFYSTNVANDANYQSPGNFGIPASYVATGSIASIAVNNPGSGYTTVVPTVVIGGDGSSGAATARMKLLTLAINAGGSGYAVGNTVTLSGGTSTVAAVITVTAVNTGAITAFTITTPGVYSAIVASFTQASTSGGGTGATFQTGTWGVDSIVVGTPGSGYTTAPISFTGGTGSGVVATAQINPAGAATASVNEAGILTIIEVLRAYFAEIQTAQEARFVNTVLRKMLAELQQGGGSTYSAANNASRAQTEAMRFFAKRIRNPNL